MSNNKKESSNKDYKDIELTSRVNRILCDEVKDSISSLNNSLCNSVIIISANSSHILSISDIPPKHSSKLAHAFF